MQKVFQHCSVVVLLFLFLFSFQDSAAQCVLLGNVTDTQSAIPVVKASIFIPELNIATTSNELGFYQFVNLPKGVFTIQFSCLGYKTSIQSVSVKDSVNTVNTVISESIMETKEVIILGTRNESEKETSSQVVTLSQKEMRENGALSISDGISKLPGMSQLSTGTGISKPVIRGLYGNRIQTQTMGVRFDNQQWQDEHGLGLSDVGIDKVEIIKGPVSLIYGSEAMGGVLNIIEEKPAPIGETVHDMNMKFFSNTLGNSADFGIKKSTEKKNWRIRLGAEMQGDYQDGNNHRVLNSRSQGYYIKAGYGFKKRNWISAINYMSSFNQFGFISIDNQDSKDLDGRWNRKMDGPKHIVFFNILSTQNTVFLKKSKLKINVGVHKNSRLENEGGGSISLNMLLNSYSGTLQWIKKFGDKLELITGTDVLAQTNTNYGARVIIPDANLIETSLFAFLKQHYHRIIIESGIRYDRKQIHTFETANLNAPSTEIHPFNHGFNSLNGALGACFNITESWNIKANASSGYRAGNLAELSSNGLHEGTYRYEIGNTNLKTEQNLNTELSFNYDGKQISFSIVGFNNCFANYIYLSPTNTEYYGFSIYRYVQKNATLQGGELLFDVHPQAIKWLDVSANYSLLKAKTDDGFYLPFIPANRLQSQQKFETDRIGVLKNAYFKVDENYVFAQNTPGQFETKSPSYFLLDAGLGAQVNFKKRILNTSVNASNLLNNTYYDHLSRFKYYEINNIGRCISVNINLIF